MRKKALLLILSLSILSSSLVVKAKEKIGQGTNIQENNIVNIKMVGDSLIHSPVYKAAKKSDGNYDFSKMFENIKSDIESADIAIVNQETIFTANRKDISSYPMFGSPVEVGEAEVNAGFDIIAHATNHTIDKGIAGINDTLDYWRTNYPSIGVLGIHSNSQESDIVYREVKGIKIAFVNYTYGLNGLESRRKGKEYAVDMLSDADIESTLLEAETKADITIAILHVGEEYVYKPTKYEQEQVDRFIDNGADIVLCAHPHVVEPYEMRTTKNGNTGIVYYSLGNYVSSQDEVPRVLGGLADIDIARIDGKVEVTRYTMEPLVTHQQVGLYTTYKLSEYTEELANKHKLKVKGLSKAKLEKMWGDIVYGQ